MPQNWLGDPRVQQDVGGVAQRTTEGSQHGHRSAALSVQRCRRDERAAVPHRDDGQLPGGDVGPGPGRAPRVRLEGGGGGALELDGCAGGDCEELL